MNPAAPSPVRFALGGLVAMAVGMGIGRFIFTPILPGMMSDLGLTPGDAGVIASANYGGYLLGAVIAGFGWASGIERPLVYASVTASAALCLAMSVADGVMLFSVIRFLAGIASAFMLVFTATIVFSHLAAANRQDLQAVHFGGVGTGIAVSSVLVAASSASGHGWREDWVGAAILSLVGLVAVFALIREGPVREGAARAEPPVAWTPEFIKINIAYGLFGFGYIITATFIIAIVRSSHGGPLLEALVWFVTGATGAISVFLWAPLLRRAGPFVSLALGCAVQAIGVAASVVLPSPGGPLIGGLLLGVTFIVITAFGFQAGRVLLPHSPRRVMAVMTAAFGVGQIIGPLIGGYVANITGDFTLATLAAAAGLVIAALFAYSAGRQKR
ncbi:YbfB/YjiJ family MFS transporter [Phyllobacterium endophyticum]|uniref:MFS transporter n=1 Tax=Phyllobacterium endophyticum TaxID=1149773 RepID=A0A2P7B2R7_9HYPH|nr:YbfB/YjiJ family MFS transporter [Phyllobacterium endophyticum]MBB3237865.1 putative MFS family arabinose efflux permease [Phyllobacterium endophyticum]PSH60756.1 MFS transporter [Phyllobacterium endophyticum]TYR42474.1 YbfB/YjiJ family MFS transporter [Phyllobacterium endophyticum]